MKIKNIFISLLVITSMLMSNVYAIDNVKNIYVSANGSDSGNGTLEAPLKTLQAANDMVAENRGSSVIVNIMAGTYNISDLKFDESNSGSANAKIVWKAYNNGEVILTSEQKIDNSRITAVNTGAVRKIPLEARTKVKQVRLTTEEINAIGDVRYTGQRHAAEDAPAYLTQDGKMYEIAGYPNKVNIDILPSDFALTSTGFVFTINDDRLNRWSDIKDAYLVGNQAYEWYEDSLKVASVSGSQITTSEGGSYHTKTGYPAHLRIVNLVEEIDYPGEFYIDRQGGYLYFYPIDSIDESTFALVTSQKSLMTIEGAQYISFENLIFQGTCSTGIVIKNSNNITLKNCEFKNIGKNAINVTDSKNTTIEGAHIHDIGKTAIAMNGGGDFKTLTPSNNVVKNCHIEQYGRVLRRTANAISVYGIGDTISHNRIHAAAHSAIMFGGNNNIIEYNDIYDVINDADDAGAIYGGRSWVDGGTQIRYNYVHDNTYSSGDGNGRSAVYLDDSFAGTKIYGNVFANMNAGVKLHGSQYNDIQNNVFINLKSSVRIGNPNGETDESINSINKRINDLLKKGEETFKSKYYDTLKANENRAAHTLYQRYFEKYDPYNTETVEYKLWDEKFPYLKNYIDSTGNHMTPKGNVIMNNATFTGGQKQTGGAAICLVTDAIKSNNTDESNYNSTISMDANNINYDKIQSEIIGFEALDIKKAGIESETSLALNDFGVVYPENQAYADPDNLVLIWDDNSGAQNYHIVISKNADLSSPIVDEIVDNAYYVFKDADLETEYYWTVEAKINHYLYSEKTKQIDDGIMRFGTRDLSNIRSLIAFPNDDTGVVSITGATSVIAGQPVAIGIWKDEYVETNTMNGYNAVCIDQIKVINEDGKNVINYNYQLPIDALSGKYYVRAHVLNDEEVTSTSFLYTNNDKMKQAKVIIINKEKTVRQILDDHLIDVDTNKGIQYKSFIEPQKQYVVTKLTGYTNYDDFIDRLDDAYDCIALLDSLKTSFDSTTQAKVISNAAKLGLTSDSLTAYNSLSDGLKDYAMLNLRETVGNAVTPADIPALFAAAVTVAKNSAGSDSSSDPTNSPTGPSGGSSSGVGNNISGGMSFGGITLDPTVDSGEVFTDLGSVEWAKTAIETLAKKGVINGKGNQKFAPLDKVTREEFLKMILVAFDIEAEPADLSFADVDKNAWYYPYVAQAVSYGIINGISDTEFGTGKNITRQDAAVIISRVVEKDSTVKLYSVDPNFKFNDIDKVSDYAVAAVEELGKAKIFSGKENDMFDPFGQATRAEAAMILYNLLYK